jgi:hypothetical protein
MICGNVTVGASQPVKIPVDGSISQSLVLWLDEASSGAYMSHDYQVLSAQRVPILKLSVNPNGLIIPAAHFADPKSTQAVWVLGNGSSQVVNWEAQ